MKQKTIKIIYWIVTILFAALMLMSGVLELIGTKEGNELIIALGYPLYLNYILGIAKVLGAIALLVPMFNSIKEWAYAGFSFDLIGASLSFAFAGGFGPMDIISPLIILAVMFVSYFSWKKLK